MGQWLKDNNIQDFENAIVVNSDDKIDSYEIINKSNLVLVYNSTIGIESAMMGKNLMLLHQPTIQISHLF